MICEGGKPWKVRTEADLAVRSSPNAVILAGDPGRIIGADETAYLIELGLADEEVVDNSLWALPATESEVHLIR